MRQVRQTIPFAKYCAVPTAIVPTSGRRTADNPPSPVKIRFLGYEATEFEFANKPLLPEPSLTQAGVIQLKLPCGLNDCLRNQMEQLVVGEKAPRGVMDGSSRRLKKSPSI